MWLVMSAIVASKALEMTTICLSAVYCVCDVNEWFTNKCLSVVRQPLLYHYSTQVGGTVRVWCPSRYGFDQPPLIVEGCLRLDRQ